MTSTVIDLDYPLPPRFDDDAHLFRCPCCCEALPAKMDDMNRWRKHITDDLNPYSCVLAGCDQPYVLFNTKESWRQHVLSDHRSITYWICFACGDRLQFNDEKAFLEHLRSIHKATIPPDQIPALVKLSQRATPEISRCPLCNWPEERVKVDKEVLLNHIAKDIHSFSLRVLPWADDNGQERDERIHDSSEKVYEWLVNNEIQRDPTKERPFGKRICSRYFHQNAYFAESSQGSSSNDPISESSRGEELEEPRKEGETIVHESQEQHDETDEDPVLNPVVSSLGAYTVGWISALPTGYRIAKAFLDEAHDNSLLRNINMPECSLGRIGSHDIVIASSPTGEYGKLAASRTAELILKSFPNIHFCLMVGIGSGVPSQNHDIRL